ncbi:hypothetical protein [Mesorhizobium sp. DCY119]|uniref:hypothetical protein n=1 Tax=Mesorhizobium sp. DCY119 TaxID=2108445 RepID=UPI000E6CD3C4|nr:hypothetical protein [Mesorhizobium sp. DCY119]RJG46547.1 hypothetical protein D3Y55_21370 [Mesorhizobium sp. DCY119]
MLKALATHLKRDAVFYTALAVLSGSMLVAGTLVTKADDFELAAYFAAQEYVCEWPDYDASVSILARIVAAGTPEDIAIEVIADEAWALVESGDVDCGELRVAEAR